MRQHLGAGATPAFGDAGSLLQFIAIDQKWNGRVKTALKSCLRFNEAGAQGKLWTLRIQAQISRFADVALRDVSQKEKNWKCSLCPEGFDTKKALTVHARHKHHTLLKYFVLGMNAWHAAKSSSIAPACLLMWEIQERVRTPILHALCQLQKKKFRSLRMKTEKTIEC